MVRYLRVDIETRYDSTSVFTALDPLTEYTDKDLERVAEDLFYNECNYGYSVVDESDVPEGER